MRGRRPTSARPVRATRPWRSPRNLHTSTLPLRHRPSTIDHRHNAIRNVPPSFAGLDGQEGRINAKLSSEHRNTQSPRPSEPASRSSFDIAQHSLACVYPVDPSIEYDHYSGTVQSHVLCTTQYFDTLPRCLGRRHGISARTQTSWHARARMGAAQPHEDDDDSYTKTVMILEMEAQLPSSRLVQTRFFHFQAAFEPCRSAPFGAVLLSFLRSFCCPKGAKADLYLLHSPNSPTGDLHHSIFASCVQSNALSITILYDLQE
ncbi:hypothetical protein B0J11DRAFT_573975 [Dendryphion nanum]|uniref:Uncharacterized protein n=1 Tax=Dendryphion nanum TaxID=256645 RepID=A0A9P9EEI9_9PLEO|nr:hypothetical protein B0J11DRAFT_573975 [Dendryphion nanum]